MGYEIGARERLRSGGELLEGVAQVIGAPVAGIVEQLRSREGNHEADEGLLGYERHDGARDRFRHARHSLDPDAREKQAVKRGVMLVKVHIRSGSMRAGGSARR